MPSFEDREKSYERQFEQQQELAFRVRVRRNHLLGLWAAAKLGLKGDAAEAYAMVLTDPAQHLHGDDQIIDKIAADFEAASVTLDATRIRFELERCAADAKKALGAPNL